MKQVDRFLLAIIAGIVVLVGVALTLTLTRPAPGYLPETTAGSVAHNYLLALKQGDDERAYAYLSPELTGYPTTVDAFTADIDRYRWNFNRDSATISVANERTTAERAVVTINETRFSEGGLFSSNQYSSSFSMTLRRHGDAWKLITADSYWATCWTDDRPCQ